MSIPSGIHLLEEIRSSLRPLRAGVSIRPTLLISFQKGFRRQIKSYLREYLKKAKETKADIIALSALLTTTKAEQRDLIEELKRQGEREKFKVLVGGGAVSKEWAKEIGADGYGENMREAVEVAKKLVGSF